ncbi:hypothetical protein ABT160_46595, partial [Streptomyces sp. NPDC001941]|uniref:hypothetical protein n=1 Tax=Streptomyces sp. NPDC001941 TaxID=3154659 RepID=UPI003328A295
MTEHLGRSDLVDLATGRVVPDARCLRHLERCGPCRDRMAEGLRRAGAEPPPGLWPAVLASVEREAATGGARPDAGARRDDQAGAADDLDDRAD